MLQGLKIKSLRTLVDERGSFTEIFRSAWKDMFEDVIVQANLSTTFPGIIRAWHKHERGQVDYFLILKGSAKICVYDEFNKELEEIISTGKNLQIIRIPGHFWHGFKSIGNEPTYLLYFVNKYYDPNNPDEIRRPWNDLGIIPIKINGKTDDPRCGKSWDWLLPPHK